MEKMQLERNGTERKGTHRQYQQLFLFVAFDGRALADGELDVNIALN